MLEEFITGEYEQLSMVVFKNENFPKNLFLKYSKPPFEKNKFALISSKNCPIDIIENIINDINPNNIYVKVGALYNENCPYIFLKKIYKELLISQYGKENPYLFNLIKNHPNWKFKDFE